MPGCAGPQERYSVHPSPRRTCGPFVFLALVLSHCWLGQSRAFAADAPSVTLPSQETVALGADDTLEFSLRLPPAPNDGVSTAPDVSVSLLKAGEAAQASNATRALVWRSPRPGEWLVHVRGLKAPPVREGSWDLLVQWKFPGALPPLTKGGLGGVGELRVPGCIAFKAEAADVVLLTDGSLSMGRNDPQRLRVEAAREFIAEARRTGSIARIAVVQFDNRSRTLCGLTPVTENFENVLEKLDERGETDIDGGIRTALQVLTGAGETPAVRTAAGGSIVLLTDGRQEPGVYGNAHEQARKAGVAVHTLALGRDADRPLLRRISEETGGTFADAAKDRDLGLAYAAIASRIARARTILLAPLAGNAAVPVPIDASCRSLALSVTSQSAGTLAVQGPGVQPWASPSQLCPRYFVELPGAGKWLADWKSAGAATGETLLASARTPLYPLLFRPDPHANAPLEIDADEPSVALSLTEGAEPLDTATVQAALVLQDGRTISAQLFDDGQHGDGSAKDGVYADYLPPFAGGNTPTPYPDSATGTLKATITGTSQGQEFRRETECAIIFRRHEGPALMAAAAPDLGRHFAGDTASAEVQLRVRGAGGALATRSLPPAQSGLQDLAPCLDLAAMPAVLKARERLAVRFSALVPELLEPGLYGGVLEFHLAGTEPVRVPWRIEVLRPALVVPTAIDLGTLLAGDKAPVQLQVAANGGVLSIYSVALELSPDESVARASRPVPSPPWEEGGASAPSEGASQAIARPLPPPHPAFAALTSAFSPLGRRLAPDSTLTLTAWPHAAITCSPAGADVDLTFDVSASGSAGPLERLLVFRDFARREIARVAVRARIQPQHLGIDAPLAIGSVETGDTVAKLVRWKWVTAPGVALLPPLKASLSLSSSTEGNPQPTLSAPELADGAAQSRFTLALPKDAPVGDIAGSLTIEAGPALATRSWSASVVQPQLVIAPAALDFGNLFGGQSKKVKLALTARTARALSVTAAFAQPFAKPRMPDITLPADAVTIAPAAKELAAGEACDLTLELNVPDSAQDGLYRTTLNLASRLGPIAVPVSLTVVNDVTTAPFHVDPSVLVLRFDGTPRIPTGSVRILSHRDEDFTLALSMKPFKPATAGPDEPPPELCAGILPGTQDAQPVIALKDITLPARAPISVTLQARADAQAGEMSCLHVLGVGEEHIVEVRIERVASPEITPVAEPPRMLNWLLFGLIFLCLIGGVAAHFAVKRPWVRFVSYSFLFHLAFLPWAMPRQSLLDALPTTVQISLYESEESFGLQLSEKQLRRLEALRIGGDPGPSDAPPAGDALTTVALGRLDAENTPLPAPAGGKTDAPSATTLEPARAADGRPEFAPAPQPVRAVAGGGLPDEPLKTDALPPDPGPAQAPLVQEPTPTRPRAISAARVAALDDAPLPAVAAPQTAPAAAIGNGVAVHDNTVAAEPAFEPAVAQPARPAPGQANANDAPLAFDDLPAVPAAVPVAKPTAAPGRAAPVAAASPRPANVSTALPVGSAGGAPRQAVPTRAADLAPAAAGLPGDAAPSASARREPVARPAGASGGDLADAPLDAGPGMPGAVANAPAVAPGGQGRGIGGGEEGAAPRSYSVLAPGVGIGAGVGTGVGGGIGLNLGSAPGLPSELPGGGRGNTPGRGTGHGPGFGSLNQGLGLGGGLGDPADAAFGGPGGGAGRGPGIGGRDVGVGGGAGGDGDEPLAAGPLGGGFGGGAAGGGKGGLGNGGGKEGALLRGAPAGGLGVGLSGNGTGGGGRGNGAGFGVGDGRGAGAGTGGTELGFAGEGGGGHGTGAGFGRGQGSSLARGTSGMGLGLGGAGNGLGAGGTGRPGFPPLTKGGPGGVGDGDQPLPAGIAGGTGAPAGTVGRLSTGEDARATPARGGSALGAGTGPGGFGAGVGGGAPGGLPGGFPNGVVGGAGGGGPSGKGAGSAFTSPTGHGSGFGPGRGISPALPHSGLGLGLGTGPGIGAGGPDRMPGAGLPGGDGDQPLASGDLGPGFGGGNGAGNTKGFGTGTGKGSPFGTGRSSAAAGTGSFGGRLGSGSGTGDLSGTGAQNSQAQVARKPAAALNAAPSSESLENAAERAASALRSQALRNRRVVAGQQTGATTTLRLGLARHSGDWNSSPTALQYLRAAFLERSGVPELEVVLDTLDLPDFAKLRRCGLVLITSNLPIAFTPAELAGIRQYILGGGTLWVNDSSSSDSEDFDRAFRAAIPQILPDATLTQLPMDHPLFSACYDLRAGFKGYRVPPGDKYRQNFIEAIVLPDAAPALQRAGLIYTRNDYADGMVIDPRMNAGMKSLTDLTSGEMLESSLRFGINMVAYSLGPQRLALPPPPEMSAEFEKLYRYNGLPLDALDDFSVTEDKWRKPVWVAEKEWCNQTALRIAEDPDDRRVTALVDFAGGDKFKAAITRYGVSDLSAVQAIVLDLYSSLKRGFDVSFLFFGKDGAVYETRPLFVRPGWNRNLRFPLNLGDLKSSASNPPWKAHDVTFEPRNAIERFSILFYNQSDTGYVKIGPIRQQK